MPRLDIRRSYDDTEIAVAQDIDDIIDDIETFTNVTGLDDDNIQDSGITGSTKIADSSIPAGKLAADSVQTANIQDDSVDKDKIAADVAGSGLGQNANGSLEVNVDDSTIEISSDTLQVKDGGITTAKLVDASITPAKLVKNYVEDTNATATSVTDSITTQGGVVLVLFNGNLVNNSGSVQISLKRSTTTLISQTVSALARPNTMFYIDDPGGAGTYTYSVSLDSGTFTTNSSGVLQLMEI